MHLFYAPDIDSQTISLSAEESKHCKALRIKKSDTVFVTNGQGKIFRAKVLDNDFRLCVLQKEQAADIPGSGYNLHIAISPTSNPARFEWFVEKATELGIHQITPLLCSRTEKHRLNYDRLLKICISAIKQSFRASLPEINQAVDFETFIKLKRDGNFFIAHCGSAEKIALHKSFKKNQNHTFLIGPEGDFTSAEILSALKNSYIPVSLGNSVLRTETAGLAVCSAMLLLNDQTDEK